MHLILALGAGMAGLLLKAKIAAWASIGFVLMAAANARAATLDVKQFVSAATFALFGVASVYLVPPGAPPRAPGADAAAGAAAAAGATAAAAAGVGGGELPLQTM